MAQEEKVKLHKVHAGVWINPFDMSVELYPLTGKEFSIFVPDGMVMEYVWGERRFFQDIFFLWESWTLIQEKPGEWN